MNAPVNPTPATVTVRQLAEQIAGLLPGTWIVAPDNTDYDRDSRATLADTEPEGGKLHLCQLWNKLGRVSVSGEYPRGDRSNVYQRDQKLQPDGITVAMSRGAEAIAREIKRRFLPAYLAAYRTGMEEMQQDEIDANRRSNVVSEFAEFAGGRVFHDGRFDGDDSSRVWMGTVNHDGSDVSLELRYLPLDLARKVIAVIREHAQARQQS